MALSRINHEPMITGTDAARTAGDVVIFNSDTIGIVADTVASGVRYKAFVQGEFELAKNTGLAFAIGEDIYWDGTELTTVLTSNDRIGVASIAVAATDAKGRILLNHPNVLLAPQT